MFCLLAQNKLEKCTQHFRFRNKTQQNTESSSSAAAAAAVAVARATATNRLRKYTYEYTKNAREYLMCPKQKKIKIETRMNIGSNRRNLLNSHSKLYIKIFLCTICAPCLYMRMPRSSLVYLSHYMYMFCLSAGSPKSSNK